MFRMGGSMGESRMMAEETRREAGKAVKRDIITLVFIKMMNCAHVEVPAAGEFFRGIDVFASWSLVVSGSLAFVVFVLFAFQMYFIGNYISSYSCAGKLAWLAGVYPITAAASIVGACVPRAVVMVDILILVYFARCLFSFVELIIEYFGGRLAMTNTLSKFNININVFPPVLRCCDYSFTPTLTNIRRLEMMVYQVGIVRPLLYFIDGAYWVNFLGNVPSKATPSPYLAAVNVLSTGAATFAISVIARFASKPLEAYRIGHLCRVMQVMILLFNLQGNVFSMLSTQLDVITCTSTMPAISVSLFWFHLLSIVECFALSFVVSLLLRPGSNLLFDLFPRKQPNDNENVAVDEKTRYSFTTVSWAI